MTHKEMRYYRVWCDEDECKMLINIAAFDTDHLTEALGVHKWATDTIGLGGNPFIAAFCPAHAKEHQSQ